MPKKPILKNNLYSFLLDSYGKGFTSLEVSQALNWESGVVRNTLCSLVVEGSVLKKEETKSNGSRVYKYYARPTDKVNFSGKGNKIDFLSIKGPSVVSFNEEDRKNTRTHQLEGEPGYIKQLSIPKNMPSSFCKFVTKKQEN